MVAVLLVTHNSAKYIPLLLSSLINQSYEPVALFIYDNASEDDTVDLCEKGFPDCVIVQSNENLGYAHSANILAEQAISAGADHLFIINADMRLDRRCIEHMVGFCLKYPVYDIIAPVLLNADGRSIQNGGMTVNYKRRTEIKRFYLAREYPDKSLPEYWEVNLVCGGVTFLKKETYEKIKLFDPIYFIYGEEFDFGYRAILADMKLAVVRDAHVQHFHDFSRDNKIGNRQQYYYIMRSKYLYFSKWKLHRYKYIALLFEIIGLPSKFYWSLKYKDLKLLMYYYLGIFHGLMGIAGRTKFGFK
jgi:GT2 family glycosyltransferase